jgi:hypothetical protein
MCIVFFREVELGEGDMCGICWKCIGISKIMSIKIFSDRVKRWGLREGNKGVGHTAF